MKKSFLLLLIPFVFAGCKKESDNYVPDTPVDIYLYANNPSFINVSTVGGWVYVTGGVRGILIYRKSNTEFMAYDRNCTYQSSQPCATVVVDATNIAAKDTCCNSRFSLYDGSVYQGPASVPLKACNTTFDGNVLHIYN
jgi:nitrite reductase/ring-hydroxylating ferredoxin subunit